MDNKKFGFTLAEILITLGVIGSISALTIPTLAYNYRSKVLEEQFKSTYSDIKQTGAMMAKDNGDLGTYAKNLSMTDWVKTFMSYMNGGGSYDKDAVHNSEVGINTRLRQIYAEANGPQGPYRFGTRTKVGILCDNGGIWTDSKGRLWTFNHESRVVCVDINGAAAPNTMNIDIFAFIPMSAREAAIWIYDDPDNVSNYSGQFVLCDLNMISLKTLSGKNLSNVTAVQANYEKGTRDNPKSVMDACPFYGPLENVAPPWETKDATGKKLKANANYWKDYVHYK